MKTARLLIVIVAAAALGVLLFRWYSAGPETEPDRSSPVITEPPPEEERTPVPKVRHPVAEPAEQPGAEGVAEEPLPSLEQSDPALREALSGLLPGKRLEDTLVLRNILGRVVLMVDALPRESMPRERVPVRRAQGDFLVEERPDGLFLSPENFQRYTPYMRLIEAADTESVVALYARYYPLFQQSYEALGYPDRYFNDRLIQVIDHLLEGPDPELPVRLVQPKVRYRYADPDLESLSAGRKILIRIGPDNAAVLKGKLREIREELIELESRRE